MGGFHSTSWSFHEEERILPPDRLQTWTEHPLFPRYPVCTLLCHWICFDSWWPYERVKSTLSCAQQPSSAPIDSCLRIYFLWIHSISCLVFLFSYYFRYLQHYCVPSLPQRTLPSYDVPRAGKLQFCHLCLHQCFRPFFIHLSGGPGYQ